MIKLLLSVVLTICPFFASASQSTAREALSLCEHGYHCLTPLLDDEERSIYADDESFINDFPFSTYPIVEVTEQGLFYIDEIDDYIKDYLRANIPWEKNIQKLIQHFVIPGTVAIDIGAHIGIHTVTMSKCVGLFGKVFSFEPSRKIYREQCLNLALNQCGNVYPIRCALGKEKGIIQVVSSHPYNEGGSYVLKEQGGENTAVIIPLDDLQLTNISFMKIDVENMEADVLDGAVATILNNRPVMLIEIQGNLQRPEQLGEDSQLMKQESITKILNLGYRLERIGMTDDYLAFPG